MPNPEFRRPVDAALKILLIFLFTVILVVFAGGYRMPPAYAKFTYPVFYLAVLAGVIYQLRSCYVLLETPKERQKLIGPMFWVALMGFFSLTHFIDLVETGSPTDKNFFLYLAPLFAVQSFLTLLESLLKPTSIPRPVADFDGPGFVVILESYEVSRKVATIKVIRDATGLGLKDAKNLVEAAPTAIKKYLSQERAEEFKQLLEKAGATSRIEETIGLHP